MSRLWPEPIQVVLHPEQVTLLRLKSLSSHRVIERKTLKCDYGDGLDAPWRNALTALGTMLGDLDARRRRATVILSNHFVRYALIADTTQVGSAEEEYALLQHQFARIYGGASSEWNLTLSRTGRPDRARVACAVDRGLTDALRTLFQPTRTVLRSIQPYLMAAFNQHRAHLRQSVRLALVEAGILCLASIQDGRWHAIRCAKCHDDWRHDLIIELDREELRSAGADPDAARPVPVLVLAPGYPKPVEVTPEQSVDGSFGGYRFAPLDPGVCPELAEPPESGDAVALTG